MKLITQPKDSTVCGQCCVAMVTGKSLKKVIEIFGHSHSTRTKELYNALRNLGFKCVDSRLKRFTNNTALPRFGILKITYDWRKNNGHWVVIKNFMIYCPSDGISHWTTYGFSKGRITSFLEIKRK